MSVLIGGQGSFLPAAPRPALRDYQAKNVNEILACLQRGRNPLYDLPTAGGKSVVLASVVEPLAQMGWEVWIYAHRRELIRQMSGHLRAVGLDHGIIAPDHPFTDDPVQVCSIDTIRVRRAALAERMARVKLMAIDEAHHATSDGYAEAFAGSPAAQRLGISATCYRYDGRPLGEMFNAEVHGPSSRALQEMGFIAPVRVIAPSTKLDLRKVKKRMGDYVASQLEAVVNTDEITRAAIYAYAQHCGGLPTIAYCVSVKHANDCAEAFTKVGWSVDVIEGSLLTGQRDRAIAGLADGRHQILFSIDCVSEGTDVPVVAAGLSLRPTGSTGKFVQQVGRTRRLYPGKAHSLWIDMVGNWALHGMPDAERQWSLSAPVKGLERAVAAVRRCGNCHHVAERGPERCYHCNRKFAVRKPTLHAQASDAAIAQLPGLGTLTSEQVRAAQLKALLPLAKTRDDLIRIQIIKNYKRAWVDYVMAERGITVPVFGGATMPLRRRGRRF